MIYNPLCQNKEFPPLKWICTKFLCFLWSWPLRSAILHICLISILDLIYLLNLPTREESEMWEPFYWLRKMLLNITWATQMSKTQRASSRRPGTYVYIFREEGRRGIVIYWFERRGGRDRDKHWFVVHLFMHSVVDSCPCPDWGSNSQLS